MKNSNVKMSNNFTKKVIRKEQCKKAENGSVFYKGVLLKKVNTQKRNNISKTYFKCPNMKTPSKFTNVCNFSGKIKDFPDNLIIKILNDHNISCEYYTKELNEAQDVSSSLLNKKRSRIIYDNDPSNEGSEEDQQSPMHKIQTQIKHPVIKKSTANRMEVIKPSNQPIIKHNQINPILLYQPLHSSEPKSHKEIYQIYKDYFNYVLNV